MIGKIASIILFGLILFFCILVIRLCIKKMQEDRIFRPLDWIEYIAIICAVIAFVSFIIMILKG